jgi:hypothetical protein
LQQFKSAFFLRRRQKEGRVMEKKGIMKALTLLLLIPMPMERKKKI